MKKSYFVKILQVAYPSAVFFGSVIAWSGAGPALLDFVQQYFDLAEHSSPVHSLTSEDACTLEPGSPYEEGRTCTEADQLFDPYHSKKLN